MTPSRSELGRSARSVALTFAVLVSGCGENPVVPELSDGVMATFEVAGDTFWVWITDEQARSDAVAVWMGESDRHIPNGKLNAGPGIRAYNGPWSWHLDSEDISMVQSASENCDGTPSQVEANLVEWVNERGRFCPSGAELIHLESR